MMDQNFYDLDTNNGQCVTMGNGLIISALTYCDESYQCAFLSNYLRLNGTLLIQGNGNQITGLHFRTVKDAYGKTYMIHRGVLKVEGGNYYIPGFSVNVFYGGLNTTFFMHHGGVKVMGNGNSINGVVLLDNEDAGAIQNIGFKILGNSNQVVGLKLYDNYNVHKEPQILVDVMGNNNFLDTLKIFKSPQTLTKTCVQLNDIVNIYGMGNTTRGVITDLNPNVFSANVISRDPVPKRTNSELIEKIITMGFDKNKVEDFLAKRNPLGENNVTSEEELVNALLDRDTCQFENQMPIVKQDNQYGDLGVAEEPLSVILEKALALGFEQEKVQELFNKRISRGQSHFKSGEALVNAMLGIDEVLSENPVNSDELELEEATRSSKEVNPVKLEPLHGDETSEEEVASAISENETDRLLNQMSRNETAPPEMVNEISELGPDRNMPDLSNNYRPDLQNETTNADYPMIDSNEEPLNQIIIAQTANPIDTSTASHSNPEEHPSEIITGETQSEHPTCFTTTEVTPSPLSPCLRLEQELEMLKAQRLCKVCMATEACITFVPCGHLAACWDCCFSVGRCPTCLSCIDNIVRTYIC
ncbi:baculoviral IAP repeat-containing protein 2 [Biomphalaria pfeifferi]|uniref:Baculoviral IAP repeat-containing protein 2 n=1 Tax=Biomphalaria pfeifferi TaxID=112525 RepID=A0AAD8F7Y9_BIOPF|nr:baculoviral IAP repeat-containing protein 2 [Biomphalaria pfeifferi]